MGGEKQRIGLALSGGGFRAAFFHVGVLARLAELGILQKVEVISTVSGGSIVGALYYLRLRNLLEEHPDGEIEKQHYIDLVADVERRLLDGVQKNIRARVFTNAVKNLAMLSPRYSRSDRIGDLYDRHFYKRAWGEHPGSRSLGREKQIEVRRLLIEPSGAAAFHPAEDNPARHSKVPILLLNATSLNSGHNWRFEAVRMGEPLPEDPAHAAIVNEVDKNMRLEQPTSIRHRARWASRQDSVTSPSASRSPPPRPCPVSFSPWRSPTCTREFGCNWWTAECRTTRASKVSSTAIAPT